MQNQKYRVVTNGEDFAIQEQNLRGFFRKKLVWEQITLGICNNGLCEAVYDKILLPVYDKIWHYGTLEEARNFCSKLNKIWQAKLEKEILEQKRLNSIWRPVE